MTAAKLLLILGYETQVKIKIFKIKGEYHLRISETSKKIKKYFNRTFGTGKQVSKALMNKGGLSEGINLITLGEFLNILDSISNKTMEQRSLKFLSKASYKSLSDIEWDKFPSKNKRTKSAIRRELMKINHKWLSDNKIMDIDSVEFDKLPIQGFKEMEIAKYFDI